MATTSVIHFILITLLIISLQHTSTLALKKSYIVYLGTHSHGSNPTKQDVEIATQSHYDLLGSVLGSYEKAQESVQHHYKKHINGFLAKLTQDEAERIKKSPRVVSVIENRRLELHTTRSWEFLGFEYKGITRSNSLWNTAKYGDGIIIANFDTGAWPESESFNDEGFGPIPSKWKGVCMTGSDPTFKCNKKLIGARYFHQGHANKSSHLSPRDVEGHGSHTLSTAGGNFVKGTHVPVPNFESVVLKGGSPKARVAVYKVCWPHDADGDGGCMIADVWAAFEAAIDDGVDVLSLSIGGDPLEYKDDGIAIGSFHAVRNGIIVVTSAGNKGPGASTLGNTAPWLFTIGASSSDRTFTNHILLGNSTLKFKGLSLDVTKVHPDGQFQPLINSTNAMAAVSNANVNANMTLYCSEDSIDPQKVAGKIVICQRVEYQELAAIGETIREAGGVGVIFVNDVTHYGQLELDSFPLPASIVSSKDGIALLKYINETANPTAHITEVKIEFSMKHSPMMASFSSRGPSMYNPEILKPDITAPGLHILAAFTGASHSSDSMSSTKRVNYTLMSGTSMACPHVAGIVALLKSLHPDWNHAAIRSALMTTATTLDKDKNPILDANKKKATPFAYGAGHINPNAAAKPGLVYNLTETDYLDYLCAIGMDLQNFTIIPYKCTNSTSMYDLNYPSITVTNFTTSITVKRTVTNVDKPATYKAKIKAPRGISVNVIPSKLRFCRMGQRRVFRLELKAVGPKPKQPEYVFGSLTWSDGDHNVRSPIVLQRT